MIRPTRGTTIFQIIATIRYRMSSSQVTKHQISIIILITGINAFIMKSRIGGANICQKYNPISKIRRYNRNVCRNRIMSMIIAKSWKKSMMRHCTVMNMFCRIFPVIFTRIGMFVARPRPMPQLHTISKHLQHWIGYLKQFVGLNGSCSMS